MGSRLQALARKSGGKNNNNNSSISNSDKTTSEFNENSAKPLEDPQPKVSPQLSRPVLDFDLVGAPPGSSPPAEKPKPPSPPKPVEDDPMDFDFTIPIPPPPVEYRHRPYVFVYPELENDDGQDCSLETALHVADFDMNCEEVVSDDLHPESEWQISDPTYYGLTFKFVDRVIGGKVPTCEESDP